MFLFLYCKDTTKSNNRQIFKGKSYYIAYYLTFINRKIKDYYIITYFLLLFMLLYVVPLYYIYTLLYIKKEQKQAEGKEEIEQGRRMPPTSSPVPRLSSVPSDVYTVHTIASRSPPHPLATSHRVREGRPPRPVQGDAIATPRHHIAANSSHRASPRRSAILPASSSSFRW